MENIDNETKVCALLSGYARELREGKNLLNTTMDTASHIEQLYNRSADATKKSWYQKLLQKLQLIQDGKLKLEDYIEEVKIKTK